jgi:glutamine amidotransferase
MIGVIDYGLGNVNAFLHTYKKLEIPAIAISSVEQFNTGANRFILPGVGSFDWAMRLFNDSGLRAELERQVIDLKAPVLGVCVGMQMLLESSEEGVEAGLGWIKGAVSRLENSGQSSGNPLPHMGWNTIQYREGCGLLSDLGSEPDFYFLHTYVARPAEAENSVAESDYFGSFTAAVQRENIYGTQFHPEKSHANGIKLLENFARVEN